MGYAGIAPIEKGDAPIFQQDVTVVKITMIDRFRDLNCGKVRADVFKARLQFLQLLKLGFGQSLFFADHQTVFVFE